MSCYNPIYAIRSQRFTRTGKHDVKIIGPLKTSRADPKEVPLEDFELLLPCCKCIGCRIDYSRRWADRMMLELDHSKKAIFVTLTYNDAHVPMTEVDYNGEICETGAFTLDKRDLQLFFKRFRKYFEPKRCRFYASGEYGSLSDRPHYHAIIFGIGLDDLKDLKIHKLNKLHQPVYISPELDRLWSEKKVRYVDVIGKRGNVLKKKKKEYYYDQIGFVSVCDVSWETCAYVARYCQKKVFGGKSYLQDLYYCEPEFSLMSRDPGIGFYYPIDHPEVFDYTVLHTSGYSKDIPVPSRFLDFLISDELKSSDNTSRWLHLKQIRKEYANDNRMTKLYNSDLGMIEQLELEENQKLRSTSVLKRECL